jgi:hypothetical protein
VEKSGVFDASFLATRATTARMTQGETMRKRALIVPICAGIAAVCAPITSAHASTPLHLSVGAGGQLISIAPSHSTTAKLTVNVVNGAVFSAIPIDVTGECESLGLTAYGYAADCPGTYVLILSGYGNDSITVKGLTAEIYGKSGADTITVTDNNAAHSGTRVFGGGGSDNITLNGAATGAAWGEDANDTLRSQGGTHQLDGGTGRDQLFGFNGVTNRLDCGAGLTGGADIALDTVHYDAGLDVLANCNADSKIANA